ncbi:MULTISPECIES: hypothetical protein [Sporosarcina]|uniref:hypothetical protein n=1 Tax=Sporosarcina TaxID=1569 RepID=UPI00078C9176|nr:hypothetical protein [Sporosarcina psychrophila]AMQ04847.1 hypothetical protein AZE41_02060 [Sporosarcina psychrophila]
MSFLTITMSLADLQSYLNKIDELLIIGLLSSIVFIWRSKKLGIAQYLLYIISVMSIGVAGYTGILGGILADELNLGGTIVRELIVISLGIFTIFYTLEKSANDTNK